MKIIRDEEFTKYICSVCGHKHVIMKDGTVKGEPFQLSATKIKTYEPWYEDTYLGTAEVPHLVEYDAYICPNCETRQMDAAEAKLIHKPELINKLKSNKIFQNS